MSLVRIMGRGRRGVVRTVVSVALLSASSLVGLAATASAAGADHLVIHTQPASTDDSGVALGTQPVIYIETSVPAIDSVAYTVTATITSGGVGVSSATAVASGGEATFSGLALNALDGSYTLTFTDSNDDTPAVSDDITVSTGPATQLAITTQPSVGEVSGVALIRQPVVKVLDSGGNVVTSVNSGNATASQTGSCTISSSATAPFSSGVASFSVLAMTGASGISCTLTFGGDSLTSVASGAIAISTIATHLVISQGPTTTPSGVALSPTVVIKVEDGSSSVVAADTSTVTAAVTAAGGTVTNGSVAAVAGVATLTSLEVNALVGSYTLTFTDGSLTDVVSSAFNVTVGPASKLAIVTEPSAAVASGAALSQQPVLKVEDSGGNLDTTDASTVSATLTSGSGTVTHGSVAASAGIATFLTLTINAVAGAYTLTFSDGALTTAISTSIMVNAGAATQLAIVDEPSATAASGTALTAQPVLKVEDSGGNAAIGNATTVTATLTTGPGTITNGTASVSPTTGLATFTQLAINATIGDYTLTFSDGVLTTAISTEIMITSGTATQLVISTQPSTTVASGAALAQPAVLKVEDASGNLVTSNTSTVSVKITSGGVSVTPASVAAVAGVASFSGLTLNALDGSYTLTFSDGALSAVVSTSITVVTGAASQLVVATEPSALSASGVALTQQPVLKVEDSGGNVETSLTTGSATASIYSGAGGAVSAGSTATFSGGVATFSGLALTGVSGSTYTLIFTGDSLSHIDTTAIKIGTPQTPLAVSSTRAVWGRSFTLTASGGSGTGAVTFKAVHGTPTGCAVSGTALIFSSTGSCTVIVTKAGDTTYLPATSPATTVNIVELAIPGVVRIVFTGTSGTLSAAGRTSIQNLVRKLTVRSTITVSGYASGNHNLAHLRAAVVAQYLVSLLKIRVHFVFITVTSLRVAQITTTAQ